MRVRSRERTDQTAIQVQHSARDWNDSHMKARSCTLKLKMAAKLQGKFLKWRGFHRLCKFLRCYLEHETSYQLYFYSLLS